MMEERGAEAGLSRTRIFLALFARLRPHAGSHSRCHEVFKGWLPIDAADTLASAGTSAKQAEPEPASHRGCVAAATNYVDWATLLRRVFDVDSMQLSRCRGRLRFIATITDQPAITIILDAVELPSRPPLPHARAPDPQLDLDPVISVAQPNATNDSGLSAARRRARVRLPTALAASILPDSAVSAYRVDLTTSVKGPPTDGRDVGAIRRAGAGARSRARWVRHGHIAFMHPKPSAILALVALGLVVRFDPSWASIELQQHIGGRPGAAATGFDVEDQQTWHILCGTTANTNR